MANIIPYREFLKRKELREQETGITVSPQQLHPSLFDWQKRIVTWACKVGRAAVWADTGLGKTRMQLELAELRSNGVLWFERFVGILLPVDTPLLPVRTEARG